ncbi:MAG: hypothetical protein ACLQUS_10105 [Desulfobaccales bacterium]
MPIQDEYQKLLELCRDIFPKTWNAYEFCDMANRIEERGILNVELHIYDEHGRKAYDKQSKAEGKPKAAGHVRYINYMNGIGNIKVSIHCLYSQQRPHVLLHELAHIAVFRLQSLKEKSYKTDDRRFCGCDIVEPDGHGKVFQRYLTILENRAIKKGWEFFMINDEKIWFKKK